MQEQDPAGVWMAGREGGRALDPVYRCKIPAARLTLQVVAD